ncbi:hypothetical protein O181_041048 [Austropuccinia psidii MF-1]|uniref:Uncharacterized protein n=1 Tax=Austropuccinia psidii MF-1 TaxID=1389203 RepID=A0A9Q3DGM7_9BASI|nr:hypothetical protein [Austropuccinia psidii MF-1]
MEGAEPFRKEGRGHRRLNSFSGVVGRFPGLSMITFKGPADNGEEEEENSVEEEESYGTEGVPDPSEPSLFAIMQQITHIVANFQAASSSDSSRPPSLKTPSIKAPECFDGTQPFKVRSFI